MACRTSLWWAMYSTVHPVCVKPIVSKTPPRTAPHGRRALWGQHTHQVESTYLRQRPLRKTRVSDPLRDSSTPAPRVTRSPAASLSPRLLLMPTGEQSSTRRLNARTCMDMPVRRCSGLPRRRKYGRGLYGSPHGTSGLLMNALGKV
jgi:hypothetical protein